MDFTLNVITRRNYSDQPDAVVHKGSKVSLLNTYSEMRITIAAH